MRIGVVVLLLLCAITMPAWGIEGGIPADPHHTKFSCTLGLTNENGLTGTFDTACIGSWDVVLGEDGQQHIAYSFSSTDGYDILATDGVTVLGTIYQLGFDAKPDPQVVLNFACKAGAADTTFSFTTGTDVLPTLTNPLARASASLTLTDNSVPANGVYANGAFGGKVYEATYNTTGVFTTLVNGFGLAGGSNTASENDPLDGISYRLVSGTVTRMDAEYRFVLKKYDSASGTSNYVMLANVPEPSSVLAFATGLIGIVGLIVRKRQ